MRPQQNRRMRGRGNNNRRGPNPLTRNYESNGPDVKIRGNAQHIADKYSTLARDAQASGDRIMAENYLQHAEHYMRIILSAQTQMVQPVIHDDVSDDDLDSSSVMELTENENLPPAGSGPQPVIEGTPTEVVFASGMNGAFDAVQEESLPVERPLRKPVRRRLPRRTEAAIAETDGDADDSGSPVKTDPAEKPRRGRRSVKAEKADSIDSSDIKAMN